MNYLGRGSRRVRKKIAASRRWRFALSLRRNRNVSWDRAKELAREKIKVRRA